MAAQKISLVLCPMVLKKGGQVGDFFFDFRYFFFVLILYKNPRRMGRDVPLVIHNTGQQDILLTLD